MWTCPKCGEKLEDHFDSCWKCAGPTESSASAAKSPGRWKRALILGYSFECLLLALAFLLPEDSWLRIKAHNVSLYTHLPLLAVLQFLDAIALLLVPLLMALVWAVLYRVLSDITARLTVRMGISTRQKRFIGLGVGATGLEAVGLAILDAADDTPRPFSPSHEIKSVVSGNTVFALDVYRVLNKQPGNVFVSPYSISTALGMVLAGARGQTEQEIAAALHLSLTQSNFHHSVRVLRERMKELRRRGRIRLTVANSIWCQEGDPFTDHFLETMHGPYQATAELVDFKRDIESARRRINQWAQRNTGNQFQDVIKPDQLGSDTSLVLCNAIYFKGRWASRFKRGETKPLHFTSPKSKASAFR